MEYSKQTVRKVTNVKTQDVRLSFSSHLLIIIANWGSMFWQTYFIFSEWYVLSFFGCPLKADSKFK